MAAVASFARSNDLTVVESHPARRSIILSGTVAAFSAAFGVELSPIRPRRRKLSRADRAGIRPG
jgi:hypothetical protein